MAVSRLPGAMRLLRFQRPGAAGPRLGLQEEEGGDVVDLSEAEPELPRSMRAFLESGEHGLAAARRWALASGRHRLPRAGVRLLAPIDDPEKVICVGLNYRDHCLEQDVKVPKEPLIFSKFPSAITGPFDDIVHPEVDWEAELAAIVGKAGRHIQESVAMEHIVGFAVANDVSARDWQMRRNGRQWLLGKTFDTFCPIGPAIVTKDSVTGGDLTGWEAFFQLHGMTHLLCRCPQPAHPLQRQRAADAEQQHQPTRLQAAPAHCLGVPVCSTGRRETTAS
uniref:Fumarylacetoacetate hydrolase domain containing 2A n=1 Tax=Coturnix japonica TaxID=93934 RepID=A0A8C2TJI9_COTJA